MTHRDAYEPPENEWRGDDATPRSGERAPFQLPTEMPLPPGENRKMGFGVSVAIHAIIVLLLMLPLLVTPAGRALLVRGAGGDGARGGGGGGMGPREGLRFIRVAPEPAAQPAQTPTPTPTITPPVVTPPGTPPVVQQPVKTPPPDVTPPLAATSPDATGAGGGSGTTTGAGPGSGGGIGSGVGTGTGSANGPGTGGGHDANHPPLPIQVFIPPQPVPSKIRPFTLVVDFDVDSTGRVLSIDFNETPDGGYNRKLKKVFEAMRFRPGVRPDGSPMRSKGQMTFFL